MPGWELLVGLRTPSPWGKDVGTEGRSQENDAQIQGGGG